MIPLSRLGERAKGRRRRSFDTDIPSMPTNTRRWLQFCLDSNHGRHFHIPSCKSHHAYKRHHILSWKVPNCLASPESVKAPIAMVERMTRTGGFVDPEGAPDYTSPILFFLAQWDRLICSGDCKNNYDPAAGKKLYPKVSNFEIYMQPGSGHSTTTHRNASAGYDVMLGYLSKNNV